MTIYRAIGRFERDVVVGSTAETIEGAKNMLESPPLQKLLSIQIEYFDESNNTWGIVD